MSHIVKNYINGTWRKSESREYLNVVNPATTELLGQVPKSTAREVDDAASAAAAALADWRNTPAVNRIQYLFKLKRLLEENMESLVRTITLECGKTLAESRGELQRAVENIEVACGIPSLIQSEFSEDIAPGIDEFMIRQPVGVAACIAPFNFPAMITFWFMPYAVACGNTYIVKSSEKVPLTMEKIFQLIDRSDFPKGVINLVNGAKETVDAILDHPAIGAISFVGSTPVAKYIYSRASARGKRVQAQGGAKNPIVILPDAELELSCKIIAESVYGCAGQRCLAAANVIMVDKAGETFTGALVEAAGSRVTGYGLDDGVEMGPVIAAQNKQRIEALIQKGVDEGGRLLLDGRGARIPGYENGYFVKPTVLENIDPKGEVFKTEIFGPVMNLLSVETFEEAIALANQSVYGNAASIFTGSGASARKFRHQVFAGNVGINIGIAAPMAFFPFSGWGESFFGELHAQGRHAVEFFTQTKIVIERWPKEWSRKF